MKDKQRYLFDTEIGTMITSYVHKYKKLQNIHMIENVREYIKHLISQLKEHIKIKLH